MIDLTNETDTQKRIRKGRDFDTMPPEERLAHYEAGQAKQKAPAPEAKTLTPSQESYLGTRRAEDLTDPLDIANFALLGGPIFQQKQEAPTTKEAAVSDAPIDFRTARLDGARLHAESAAYRLEVANAFSRVKSVGPQNARETDLLLASSWVQRAA